MRFARLTTAAALVVALPGTASFGQGSIQLELAHPIVKGAAGPFAQATVKMVRPKEGTGARFTATLEARGKQMTLPGPDEPADLFLLEPRAVLFTRIDGSRQNGIVILYDSRQIGPGHGTDHRALVYRVGAAHAARVPALEARLEGAGNAATARARLARVR